jgi:hypothetical protein
MMTLAQKREKTYQYNNKRLEARKKKELLDHFEGTPAAVLSIKTERLKLLGARHKG